MARKKGLTLNKVRGGMYRSAKYLGDVQALTSSKDGAVTRRIGRRIVGRFFGQLMGAIFRQGSKR